MTVAGTKIDPELARELAAIAERQGCELLHAEWKGGLLRLFLDRAEGGVSLSDCEAVSRQASALLDVVDFGSGRYTLEVSSPGLDRQLYGPRDYERFAGRQVKVTYREPGEGGAKRTVSGRLVAFRPEAGGSVELDVGAGGAGAMTVPLARIQVARLEIEV
jgi:ribosome maturation factor RimP